MPMGIDEHYKIERTRKQKTSVMLSAGFEVERKDAEFC